MNLPSIPSRLSTIRTFLGSALLGFALVGGGVFVWQSAHDQPTKLSIAGSQQLDAGKLLAVLNNSSAQSNQSKTPAVAGTATVRSINLNTATQKELETLPSIGPVTAGRILEYRNAHGPFTSVNQLDNVKGIGPKTLEKLKPYLRVND